MKIEKQQLEQLENFVKDDIIFVKFVSGGYTSYTRHNHYDLSIKEPIIVALSQKAYDVMNSDKVVRSINSVKAYYSTKSDELIVDETLGGNFTYHFSNCKMVEPTLDEILKYVTAYNEKVDKLKK